MLGTKLAPSWEWADMLVASGTWHDLVLASFQNKLGNRLSVYTVWAQKPSWIWRVHLSHPACPLGARRLALLWEQEVDHQGSVSLRVAGSRCDPEEVHAGSLGVSQAEMEASILEWDMLNLVAHVWFDGVAVPAPCLSILTVSWRPSQGPSLLLSQVAHIPPEDRLCLP